MFQAALDALQDLRDILENEVGSGGATPSDDDVSDWQRCHDAIIHAIEHLRLP